MPPKSFWIAPTVACLAGLPVSIYFGPIWGFIFSCGAGLLGIALWIHYVGNIWFWRKHRGPKDPKW